MAQIVYTPKGEMDQVIEFWDQPTAPAGDGSMPDPVLFASGIFAKLESLWSSSRASKQQQQVLAETTHRITITAMPGLTQTMFIRWTDANGKTHRYEIDSINDPNGKNVEYRILAIERNDGQ